MKITREELRNVNIQEKLKGRFISGQDLASELVLRLSQTDEVRNGRKLTNWDRFNFICGGLRPCELTIITSDTGLGKTTFSQNIASNILMQGEVVLYIALENSILDVLQQIATISTREVLEDIPTIENKEVLNLFCNTDGARLYFLEQSHRTTGEEVIQAIILAKEKYNCSLVIVDHLDAITPAQGSNTSEVTAQKRMMYQIHNACKSMQLHCIAIQHPAKLGDKGNYGDVKKRQDRHLMIDELKGSSAVKQVADMIITLRRTSEIENCTEITFQKIRYFKYGRNIGGVVKFCMHPDTYRFEEMGLYE